MKKSIEFTKSSGNVYEDLGFVDPRERLSKAKLTSLINELIRSRGLKQTKIAKILHITQPKVSALSNGRLSGFSVEKLFHFLTLLDQDIEIIVHPKSQGSSMAVVSILSAR